MNTKHINNVNNDYNYFTDIKNYLLKNEKFFEDIRNYVNQTIKQNKYIQMNIPSNFENIIINKFCKTICESLITKNLYTDTQLIRIVYEALKNDINIDETFFFSSLCILEYLKNNSKKINYFSFIFNICIGIMIEYNVNNVKKTY